MTHQFLIVSESQKFNVAITSQSENSPKFNVAIINQSEHVMSYLSNIKSAAAVAKVSVLFDNSLGYKQPPELSANE